MKKCFSLSILFALLISACKKDTGGGNNNVGGNNNPGSCLLTQFQFTGVGPSWYFEYNAQGKLAKTRYFNGGTSVTRVFEYNTQNMLTKIYDSAFASTYYTDFSGHTPAGNPGIALSRINNKKQVEITFAYDAKGNVGKKIFQFFDINEMPLSIKDTLQFYYDTNGNIIKETALTRLNGIRREYIILEAEGYDNKVSFYKSLGIEFSLMYRYNRLGEGPYNLGEYIYGPCTNNPGKVYLHNQAITDDSNKGDYLTYSYEYGDKGYPSKISYTYTNSSTTNPIAQSRFAYKCN